MSLNISPLSSYNSRSFMSLGESGLIISDPTSCGVLVMSPPYEIAIDPYYDGEESKGSSYVYKKEEVKKTFDEYWKEVDLQYRELKRYTAKVFGYETIY